VLGWLQYSFAAIVALKRTEATVLVTLLDPREATRVRAWLVRSGFEARVLGEGTTLLVEDPFVPFAIEDALRSDPAVAVVEATVELPRRVRRYTPDDAPWPFEGGYPDVIAGPCSVESPEVAEEVAACLSRLKLGWMRGGTHKIRTSPEQFQGAGLLAARWLREACDRHGLRAISEVVDTGDMEAIADMLDILQVGARQMHNPHFLQRVAALRKPVLLKRGLSATPLEWLWAGEYLLKAGAPYVIFCERGIRTPSPLKRFTLDLQAIPFIRQMSAYPVFVDPSHAAGSSPYVLPLALGARAAGAQGLLVECHPDPSCARSDATQALDLVQLEDLVRRVRALHLEEVTP